MDLVLCLLGFFWLQALGCHPTVGLWTVGCPACFWSQRFTSAMLFGVPSIRVLVLACALLCTAAGPTNL